jgi:hypothetical protein
VKAAIERGADEGIVDLNDRALVLILLPAHHHKSTSQRPPA